MSLTRKSVNSASIIGNLKQNKIDKPMARGYKTGGRETGTPNRLTSELRSLLKEMLFNELQSLPDRLDKLPDKDRIDVMLKLIPYICPKVQDVPHDKDEPFNWGALH